MLKNIFSFIITLVFWKLSLNNSTAEQSPCIYEGQIRSNKLWYGFIANVTIMTTGVLHFEISYPAEKCCQNILFYLDDQISILNARMNCWDKENLLRPENDQILRLTPRFTWSGCHMSHVGGLPTYVCKGGRSFTATEDKNVPTSWYIAVSNCASLLGLELKYRMVIYGHIGKCKTENDLLPTSLYPSPSHVIKDGQAVASYDSTLVNKCVLDGYLNSNKTWYGFIANATFNAGGGFRFQFSYPYYKQVLNIILYEKEDLPYLLSPGSNCWQKESLVRKKTTPYQIMDLSFKSSWNGCSGRNTTTGTMLICKGERTFTRAKELYFAVNNCRSNEGLELKYRLEFTGYTGNPCNGQSAIIHKIGNNERDFIMSVISLILYLGMIR